MGMDYLKKTYAVPAKRGRRVIYDGGSGLKFGTVSSASNGYLNVRFDGSKGSHQASILHPTWRLIYLDSDGVTPIFNTGNLSGAQDKWLTERVGGNGAVVPVTVVE